MPAYKSGTPSGGNLTVTYSAADTNVANTPDATVEYNQYCDGAMSLSAISATVILATVSFY